MEELNVMSVNNQNDLTHIKTQLESLLKHLQVAPLREQHYIVPGDSAVVFDFPVKSIYVNNTSDTQTVNVYTSGSATGNPILTVPPGTYKLFNFAQPKQTLFFDNPCYIMVSTQEMGMQSNSVILSNSSTQLLVQGILNDGSSSIAAAGTSQQVFGVNINRKYLLIQNASSANLWFNFTDSATEGPPSLVLTPGASFIMENNFVSTEAVNIIGGTAGQAFVAKEG